MTIKERRQHLIISELKERPYSFDDLYKFLEMNSKLMESDLKISFEAFKQDIKDILKKKRIEIIYDNSLKAYKINAGLPQNVKIFNCQNVKVENLAGLFEK